MLEVSDLSGGWGPTVVVEDFHLKIRAGETVALIGRNGVGKSTLLELLVGRARRRGGHISLAGADITKLPIHERARSGIGYVPQGREVFPSLTVKEHLEVAARPGEWDVPRVLALFPRLGERLGSYGTQLSGGEQQMLSVARALLGNPSLLLMDEPFEGLSPLIVKFLLDSIRSIVASGSVSLLLVEQRVDLALELSRRCLVLDRGRCVFEGTSSEVRQENTNLAALMGLTPVVH